VQASAVRILAVPSALSVMLPDLRVAAAFSLEGKRALAGVEGTGVRVAMTHRDGMIQ
jgi:hypothetical protein